MVIDWWIDRAEADVSAARDVKVALLAARQHGVLSVAELVACGLDRDAISVRVRNGRLHPMHKGVYAVGHANPTRDGCYLGAVKACDLGAVLSHWAAGVLHCIIEWEERYPDVLVLSESAPQHPRIKRHRNS